MSQCMACKYGYSVCTRCIYACAIYIVSYISKAQKGTSELLRTACEEAKRGNSRINLLNNK